MTRITHLNGRNAEPEVVLLLTIWQTGDTIKWSYSKDLIIVNEQTHISILLANQTSLKANITSYASTGVSAEHLPLKTSEQNDAGQWIRLQLSLLPNQLIDFGVFVHLVGDDIDTTIFCDPQASNDPIKTP